MLTIFTTPKPFRGHIDVIQRNALRSWTLLAPDVEVILFGDEEGAAQAARDIGIRHEPHVRRNAQGSPYLTAIFDRAQELAGHQLVCYANCDIILLGDLPEALSRLAQPGRKFLMSGRRWDTDIREPLDFTRPTWASDVRRRALQANHQRPGNWIDYFAFPRGLFYQNTPSFVIGRPGWDNWLLWRARSSGALLVDASDVVVPVHQNHDYSHHPKGEKEVWEGEEAAQNAALLKDGQFATLENATHRLTPAGLRRNWRHWPQVAGRKSRAAVSSAWFALLGLTRPLRNRLGLRRGGAE